MSDVSTTAGEATGREFFGHPKGLAVCFMTEMWERFSYYGMRALLIFYLTQHFLFGQSKAFLIYGAYTSLVYITPVIGGILADRYLGARKAVTMGAILLVLGHFGMAFEGPAAVETASGVEQNAFYLQIFYLSLALIITGVGFLKANISTIVGELYEKGDARRDPGFTIFYMGINLGAFLGAIIAGWLGQTWGWAWGFGAAGVGMLGGLYVFLAGQKHLRGKADPPDAELLKAPVFAGLSREIVIYIGAAIGVVLVWQLVQYQEVVGQMLLGFGGVMLLTILVYSFAKCTPVDRDKMLVASSLIVFSVIFWALFEQAGSSLNIFTDQSVDRVVLGYELPASIFQSLNSFFIITLAPFFSVLWLYLSKRNLEPNTPMKFALAIFQVGLGFLVLVFGVSIASDPASVGLIWLVLIYLLHTTGELCLSPVGLSMITKLSVGKVVGMMMGVWFMASAAANFIAGLIARLTAVETTAGVADAAEATAKSMEVYTNVGLTAVGVAVVLLVISPFMAKRMHDVH